MDDRGLAPLIMAGNSRNIAQREVASLLANHHEAADVRPWVSLSPGRRLGPYEILALIGAGGMGRVYTARDTRLKREVAIKICKICSGAIQ